LAVPGCAQPKPIITPEEGRSVRAFLEAVEQHYPAAAGAIRKMTEAAEKPPAPAIAWGDVLLAVLGIVTGAGAIIARVTRRSVVAQLERRPSRTGLTLTEVERIRALLPPES
jgi:hypothetical protein